MVGAGNPHAVEEMTNRARRRQEENREREQRRLAQLIQRGISPDRLPAPRVNLLSVAQVERGHLDERLGLFVIIVLGEALAQVVAANTELDWTRAVIVSSLAGFLILVQLWQLTSLYGFTPAPRRTASLEPWQALPAHLGVTASIVAIAAGFGGLIPAAGEHLHTKDRWFVFGGLALYVITSVVAALFGRAPLKWYLGWALPSLLVLAAVAVFGHPLPAWSLALIAYGVLAWFAAYNKLVDTRRA
ncbi:hypothetical protein GCM10028799_68510 [Kribbella italica]